MVKNGGGTDPAPFVIQRKRRRRWPWLIGLVVVIVCGLLTANYLRPVPQPTTKLSLAKTPAVPLATELAWPKEGTAAVSAQGYNFVATNSKLDTSFSAASMIKLVSVLCILEKKPLAVGEAGPSLTMTAADVALYEKEVARKGNNIKIVAGEQMSQYHALEATLIESANNITDTMVIWAFGSMNDYRTYALDWLKKHDMLNTRLGSDASGMDPATTSTLGDLVKLAKIAQKNSVIMQILGTPSANFQNAGTIRNRNKLLGNKILVGGKTGSLDDIKGSYLFMAKSKTVNPGIDLDIVGVIAYDSSVQEAISASERLAASAAKNFEIITYVRAGDSVGEVSSAWGERATITAQDAIQVTRWQANEITPTTLIDPVVGAKSGRVGTLTATTDGSTAQTTINLERSLQGPSFWWRLTRWPF